ncbi:Prenylated Rab acceptor 1 [Sporothrix bragantina]|uniref:Prenylated Rab acceptor 1 n=1 Tax=Sporothrix bragantina TaxID=671064 RepID=A0ABP0AM46_9PEZI
MARIRRAQVKGKAQVNLSKMELAALGRHKEREARAVERQQRRKERTDRRIAVPIEHLETMSRSLTKLPTPGASGDDDGSPQRVPGSFHLDDRQGYPPVGHFPPPNASARALPSSSSQPVLGSDRSGQEFHRGDSPFTYSYLRGTSSARHVSDPATTANHVDPFQYMTAGPRAPPYPAGAATAPRHGSASSADKGAYARGPAAAPAAARGRRGPSRNDTESSEEEGDSTASDNDDDDDETDNGRRPPVHNTRSRAKLNTSQPRRRNEIVVEVESESESEPEPEPERVPERSRSSKTKKPSRSSSSANPKRKSTGASSSNTPVLHSSRQRKRK